MTFLNPLLLFGLVAAAIPIIIHLLNLRKLRTVEFSTLQFLKELQRTKMRRVKVRQWLLLALRVLLVAAVVMAFARPALRGSLANVGAASTHAKTTLVIVVDDSPSMTVRNERGVLFSQAQELTLQILDLVKEGDEVYFIPLSSVHTMENPLPTHDVVALKNVLEKLSPTFAFVPFRDALGVAARVLSESKNVNREVYLVTDAQATHLRMQQRDSADLFDDRVKLFVADVRQGSTTEANNVGVTEAAVTSRIVAQDKPATLRAAVFNASAEPLRGAVLSVYMDGTRMAQDAFEAAPRAFVSHTLSVVPKRRGMVPGYVQLEDDLFEADNRRWFVLHVPDHVAVLCVGATLNDTRFPALSLTLDRDSSGSGLFDVEAIAESQFSARDVNRYDVLILCGVKDISSGEADRLGRFVEAGGGMIIFPGKDMDIENYNAVLFPRLGIPKVQVTPPTETREQAESRSFLSFSTVEFEHPLFTGLFDRSAKQQAKPSIESPRIFRTIIPQLGVNGNSLIQLSDGTSFLTEYRRGAGTVLLFSVEAGVQWSDFPLKPLFAPLVYRSSQFLAQSITTASYTVGEEMRVQMRLKDRGGQFVLRSPSGIDERIVPQSLLGSGAVQFVSSNLTEPGLYELRHVVSETQSALVHLVPVNISAEETDLRHASAEEVEAFLAGLGVRPDQVRFIAQGENLETKVMESRLGVELWKLFVGLALACALAEMAIGRESKTTEA